MPNTETKRPPIEERESTNSDDSYPQIFPDETTEQLAHERQRFVNVVSLLDTTLSDEEVESLRLENLSKHLPEGLEQPSLEDIYENNERLIPPGRDARRNLRFVYALRVGMAERRRRVDGGTNIDPEFKKDVSDLTDVVDRLDESFFKLYADEIKFISGRVPLPEKKSFRRGSS